MHFPELDRDSLNVVTGGENCPPPPKPILQPMPNMGFPKYSAGWWELVRARGLPG